jgi:hypothetical protein
MMAPWGGVPKEDDGDDGRTDDGDRPDDDEQEDNRMMIMIIIGTSVLTPKHVHGAMTRGGHDDEVQEEKEVQWAVMRQ